VGRSRQILRHTPQELRADLFGRLEARRAEIGQAVLTRIHAVSDQPEAGDPTYVAGLRAAAAAALDYGLTGIAGGQARSDSIPAELFVQARHAVRAGIGLDTVLRRYFAGYTLLGDFLMQEAEDAGFLGDHEFQRLMKLHAARFDRLIGAIAAEYEGEADCHTPSLQRRRADCVGRLLAGELADTSELVYELNAQHLGIIAAGPGAEGALRALAATLDRRLLLVRRDESTSWAWLGGNRPFDVEEVERVTAFAPPPQVCLAVGGAAEGLDGWRFTHHQAAAASPIAQRTPGSVTRYVDVALLASMLQDQILIKSLNEIYLAPLMEDRDGGTTLRVTLRAYFATERNVSSAASVLGVSRKTVTRRLRETEQRLGHPLGSCATEIDAALRLEQMEGPQCRVPKRDSVDGTITHNGLRNSPSI
jgi:DNA-binding phage protein